MTPEDIKKIRAKLGLTQQQLADKINVKVDTVRSWEGGRRKPDGPAEKLLGMVAKGKI